MRCASHALISIHMSKISALNVSTHALVSPKLVRLGLVRAFGISALGVVH